MSGLPLPTSLQSIVEHSQFKVSVVIICYNQAEFIQQAVESVLMQETLFLYELVIGDDYSRDGTYEKLIKISDRNRGKIRLLTNEKNLGVVPNFLRTISQCKGEFIALLEGDDYWSDTKKLAKQIAMFDKNPDFALVHHRVNVMNLTRQLREQDRPSKAFRISRPNQEALVASCFLTTCSVMFRANAMPTVDIGFKRLNIGDWPLFLLIAEKGAIGYCDEAMACYRIHSRGCWSSQSLISQYGYVLETFRYLMKKMPKERKRALRSKMGETYYNLAKATAIAGNKPKATRYCINSILCSLHTRGVMKKSILLLVSTLCPNTTLKWRRLKAAVSQNWASLW